MTIGKNIKAARKKRGITQKELAHQLGVTQSAIAKFETDATNIKFSTLQKIAEHLDTNSLKLLEGDQHIMETLSNNISKEEKLINVLDTCLKSKLTCSEIRYYADIDKYKIVVYQNGNQKEQVESCSLSIENIESLAEETISYLMFKLKTLYDIDLLELTKSIEP